MIIRALNLLLLGARADAGATALFIPAGPVIGALVFEDLAFCLWGADRFSSAVAGFAVFYFYNRNRGRASLKDRVAPVVDTCTRVGDAEDPEKNL